MSDAPRHPLHPALVHFPIAFWMSAVVLDLVQWSALLPRLPGVEGFALPHLMVWMGLVAAIPAIALGLFDYARLPQAIQNSRPMQLHMICMGTAWLLFLGAGLWRLETGNFADAPNVAVILLEILGAICLIVGGAAAARVVFELLPGRGSGGQ